MQIRITDTDKVDKALTKTVARRTSMNRPSAAELQALCENEEQKIQALNLTQSFFRRGRETVTIVYAQDHEIKRYGHHMSVLIRRSPEGVWYLIEVNTSTIDDCGLPFDAHSALGQNTTIISSSMSREIAWSLGFRVDNGQFWRAGQEKKILSVMTDDSRMPSFADLTTDVQAPKPSRWSLSKLLRRS